MTKVNESVVEEAALDWFQELGYETLHGPDLATDDSGDALIAWPPALTISGQIGQDERGVGMPWQLQEAKQRFSELVRRTLEEGPQVVTRHGEEVVVVVPAEEFRRMQKGEQKPDFKEFLMNGPDLSVLDLERPKEMPRDIEL